MTDSTIDPDETRDFQFDWQLQLGTGETITDHQILLVDADGVPTGNATVLNTSATDMTVTVRLSGASGPYVYLLCRVTTSTGQVLDDTWKLLVTDH